MTSYKTGMIGHRGGGGGGHCQNAQKQNIIKTYKELIMYKLVGKYQYHGFCYYCVPSNLILSTKTYVVCTQKNRRNETVLLSSKLLVKADGYETIYYFTLKNCVYLDSDVYSM